MGTDAEAAFGPGLGAHRSAVQGYALPHSNQAVPGLTVLEDRHLRPGRAFVTDVDVQARGVGLDGDAAGGRSGVCRRQCRRSGRAQPPGTVVP